jgi:hypothetical protein
MGNDEAVWHIWQVSPNGGWSDWQSLGKPAHTKLSNPFVGENADGHLEVFALGGGVFCNIWQEASSNTGWRHEGWNEKKRFSDSVEITWLEVALNREAKLEVLGLGTDGALWHSWQEAPAWSEWHSLGTPSAKISPSDKLTVGRNQDGRLEAFLMGQDGAVWQIWQTR